MVLDLLVAQVQLVTMDQMVPKDKKEPQVVQDQLGQLDPLDLQAVKDKRVK